MEAPDTLIFEEMFKVDYPLFWNCSYNICVIDESFVGDHKSRRICKEYFSPKDYYCFQLAAFKTLNSFRQVRNHLCCYEH